jgi:hypothetical protein
MRGERLIAGDRKSCSSNFNSIPVDDEALTRLTEHNADRTARRQLGLPTIIIRACQPQGLDRFTSDETDRGEIPGMRDGFWLSRIARYDHCHAGGRDVE